MSEPTTRPADPILAEVRGFYESHHEGIERSRRSHSYYYECLTRILRVRVPPGERVLDLGCGAGHLLAALEPARGVGIDVSSPAIRAARESYGGERLSFVEGDASDPEVLARAGGPFDTILLVNLVTHLSDVQATLEALHAVSHPRTRVLIYSYSRLWQPLLRLSELLGMKYRQPPEAWLPPEEIKAMLALADFEIVRDDAHVVCPVGIPLVADLANRYLGRLPLVDAFSLMFGIIARPAPVRSAASRKAEPTVSVVIPCRNEAGHIAPLVESLPKLPAGSEFLFVEGHSTDDTAAVIERAVAEHKELPLRFFRQPGKGKGDAVRFGFAQAKGDVLLILDSDMGVAPADVAKFVTALARGKCEMVNGSRLVYPMEGRAMRFLNLLANKFFAFLFSWLLGQQVRDTLCGTKALWREDYERIAANRSYFGEFDPFGDFDLLFGAARLNLRIVDLAVRYHERQYGETNISRFSHGWLLLRMSAFAARKLKLL
ncbi:MAG TPA: glycosyltransferase [Vicinamibacteria bacterium]|nr:glycosyltransferase [Vicinamibacteria bacterium]